MQFDVAIVGADVPGLCTAACMARRGAKVALIKSPDYKPSRYGKEGAAIDAIPNFVWRRLDLQNYDIAIAPIGAIVTLLADGQSIKTHETIAGAAAALEAAGVADHTVWRDFVRDAASLSKTATGFSMQLAAGSANGATKANNAAPSLHDLRLLTGSLRDILDDYFEDENLKTHIGARALGVSGLGGAEPGSVFALSGLFEPSAWPARRVNGALPIEAVLETVCTDAGVVVVEATLERISGAGEKYRTLGLKGADALKARYVFFATPAAARRARVEPSQPSPVSAAGAAHAIIRIKLSDKVDPPGGEADALFQIADTLENLQDARDAVATGRLPEKPPLQMSFAGDTEIIVRTPYCPDRFVEDGETREWSSQDRQVLSALVVKRLSAHIKNINANITRTDVVIEGAWSSDADQRIEIADPKVVAPPASADAVAMAVSMADRLLDGR